MEQNSPDSLNFDKAVPAGVSSGVSSCAACKHPLTQSYFALNGQMFCSPCTANIQQGLKAGHPGMRILKAFLFGLPTAVVGAGIFYLVAAMTGYEFGLIAILIGFMVGYMVRKGSDGLGGLPYQVIAVLLTYFAICSTYIPSMIKGMENSTALSQSSVTPGSPELAQTDPVTETTKAKTISILGYLILFVISLAIPFLSGFQNILGLLIIGFGLYQAWQMNVKANLKFDGPFEIKNPVS